MTTSRRVATPLLKKVKAVLERMENMGVISKVDVPTECCAGMVVVLKPDGNVRICVDLTKLNENVLRETYPPPKIDNLLSQISESKIFSKLDCNSGYWREKLDEQSLHLSHLAEKTKPIRDRLSKNNEFHWGPAQQQAFEGLKVELSSAPVLAFYDPSKN